MNISDLRVALPTLFKTGRTPHLIGHKGTGKSSLMVQFGKQFGYDQVVDLRIGQISDVSELIGLPYNENGVMRYARPYWLPKTGKVLIVLDEINRATKDVVQGVFQLVYDKKIGPHELNGDVHIIALSNPPTDDYITLDFNDEAFQDRFVHIKFEPTLSEFKDYLVSSHGKGSSDMLEFLNFQPELVTTRNADDISLDFVSASNRSTDYFIKLEKEKLPDNIMKELSYGILGTPATIAYWNFKNDLAKIKVTANDVIVNYKEAKKKIDKAVKLSETGDRSDIHNNIVIGLLEFLEKRQKEGEEAHAKDDAAALANGDGELTMEEHKNIKAYMEDMPLELFTAFCRQAVKYVPFYCTIGLPEFKGICTAREKEIKKLVEEIDKAYEQGKTRNDVVAPIKDLELPTQGQTNV